MKPWQTKRHGNPLPGLSLRDRIRKAQSPEEVVALVKEGDTYHHASRRTRRRWIQAAP